MIIHGSAQADFNFSLIHRVTIGSYRSTSRISHGYRDYRMAIATIAWLSRLSHGYRAHKMVTIRVREGLLVGNGENIASKKVKFFKGEFDLEDRIFKC